MDFRRTSLDELAVAVQRREHSARALAEHALARIEELDPALNCFVSLDPEGALAQADVIDRRVAEGDPVGPLAGIPLGVKDLEDAAGFPTTHGSPTRRGAPAAAGDSVEVARLRAAGCVVLGKTNTPEFGHKAETDNPLFGPTRNPWDTERSAGGSSGGSAAAVAAGMVPLATGSDGGGSIRIPSAVCGLSGFKCSLGRVPAGDATPPHWGNLSSRGPMARRIRDVALALDVVVGPEPNDLRSLPAPPEPWTPQLARAEPPARIGWSPTLGYASVDAEIAAVCAGAVEALAASGIEVVEIDEVWPADPVEVWFTIAATHHLRALGDHQGTEVWDEFDPLLQAAIGYADATVSATDYLHAEDEVHRLNARLAEVLTTVDVLCTPAVAGQTPFVGQPGTIDGEADLNWVKLTYPFNLTRSPAGTVPVGTTTDGMPVGLQVVGAQHDDIGVLRALAAFEDLLDVDLLPPLD